MDKAGHQSETSFLRRSGGDSLTAEACRELIASGSRIGEDAGDVIQGDRSGSEVSSTELVDGGVGIAQNLLVEHGKLLTAEHAGWGRSDMVVVPSMLSDRNLLVLNGGWVAEGASIARNLAKR